MIERHFEDFHPDDIFSSGSITVTKEEIIAFARQFDPQPFHIDEEAARRSAFGGLIAAGAHTVALFTRPAHGQRDPALRESGVARHGRGALAQAVRPGDTLRARITVAEATPSRSKPDRGLVRLRSEVFNQRDEMVMSLVVLVLLGRRPA